MPKISIETELQNRLLGLMPSPELQDHYAAIFCVSPDLAFAKAYADGYYKAGCMYVQIIEQLVKTIEEKGKDAIQN